MSTSVGDIFVRARLDTAKYKQELTGLQKVSEKASELIGSKLKSAIAGIGLAVASKALWNFANTVAKVGDTIDKSSQKLGMTAQAYQEWDYVMQRCGASIDSMTAGMRTLSSMAEQGNEAFQELGISQAELQNLSQEQLFERTVTALQNLDDKTRRTYLASKLLGRGSMELGALLNMSAQDTANLRNNLTSLGGMMSDVAVKNSASFTDAMTDIKMALRSIYNTFAEYILPRITAVLNNYVIPVIQKIGQAFLWLVNIFRSIGSAMSGVGKIFGGIKAGVAKAFGKETQKDTAKSATSIGKVSDAVGGTGKSAKGAKKQVQALKRELLGFDQIVKLTSQDSAGTGSGGSGGGIGGLGGMDLSGLDEVDKYASIADKVAEMFKKIQIPDALQVALGKLGEAFKNLFGALKDAGEWILDKVLKPLGEWFINNALPPIIEALASALNIVAEALKIVLDVLKPVWEALQPLVDFVLDAIVEALQLIAKVLDLVATGIKWIRDNAVKPFTDWYASLGSVSEELGKLKKKWDEVKGALAGKIATAKVVLEDKLSGAWKTIKSTWNTAKSYINGKVASAKITLVDNFSRAWKGIKGAWNSIKNKTATVKLAFTEKIKSLWNATARKVQSARAKSAFARTILPNMPLLAEGGYVKANTPQLAVIGDNKTQGEIVAPEGKLAEMARQASGNPQMISLLTQILTAIQSKDTNVYLDGKQIADNTVGHINRQTRQTGRLSLVI